MTANLMTYAQARKEFGEHVIRQAEVPVEYSISLPVPTMRWDAPGYAGFAGPAIRAAGEPLRLRRPDRWWLFGARRGDLLIYSRVSALPFGPVAGGAETVTVPAATQPVAVVLEGLRVLEETMERAAGPFFGGEPGDETLRSDLRAVFAAQVGAPDVLDWYRALAPDFFSWLGR